MEKTYLGDGTYIEFDEDHFILTTSNGRNVTNMIFLELEVVRAMLAAIKTVVTE